MSNTQTRLVKTCKFIFSFECHTHSLTIKTKETNKKRKSKRKK